jgi:hypothetical protein
LLRANLRRGSGEATNHQDARLYASRNGGETGPEKASTD